MVFPLPCRPLTASLFLLAGPLGGQEPPRYDIGQLACATFRESITSFVRPSPGRPVETGRRGFIRVRAAPTATDSLAIEMWYDSLAVWRRSEDGELRPDTDGLIGGRYRGALAPDGGYAPRVSPFVPEEVAQVADLASMARDFFPRLPPRALTPGDEWRGTYTTIAREPDSLVAGVPLARYRIDLRRDRTDVQTVGPGLTPIDISLREEERGRLVWHPELGLLRRERLVVVESEIPAQGPIKRPSRNHIEQRIVVERVAGCD
ncbi:MAG: hypothetical protein ACOY71_04070 [Gemmatimonadota bacterium]